MWILCAWDGFLVFFQLLVSVSVAHSLTSRSCEQLFLEDSTADTLPLACFVSVVFPGLVSFLPPGLPRLRSPATGTLCHSISWKPTKSPSHSSQMLGAPVGSEAVPVCWAKLSSWVSQALREFFSNQPMRWVCLSLVLKRLVAFLREKKKISTFLLFSDPGEQSDLSCSFCFSVRAGQRHPSGRCLPCSTHQLQIPVKCRQKSLRKVFSPLNLNVW